jgi:protein phosphatase
MHAPSDSLCAITDTGSVRPHNEDAFSVSDDMTTLIIADGMGGHADGEAAAAIAIETVIERLVAASRLEEGSSAESVCREMTEAFGAAHARVAEAGQWRDDGREMGCTLILARIVINRLYTCHVGDVRCYVYTSGGLIQITRDHSVVARLVEEGHLTPDDARCHPNKNQVLQAIGMPYAIEPDCKFRDLQENDRVLLCSDGLWEALSHEEIAAIVGSDGSVRQLATLLVDRAIDVGGTDNITVILYQHLADTALEAT